MPDEYHDDGSAVDGEMAEPEIEKSPESEVVVEPEVAEPAEALDHESQTMADPDPDPVRIDEHDYVNDHVDNVPEAAVDDELVERDPGDHADNRFDANHRKHVDHWDGPPEE